MEAFSDGVFAIAITLLVLEINVSESAAIIFYSLVLLSISVLTSVLWRYVAKHRDLLQPNVTERSKP